MYVIRPHTLRHHCQFATPVVDCDRGWVIPIVRSKKYGRGDVWVCRHFLTGVARGHCRMLHMHAQVNLGKDLEVVAKNGRVVVVGSRGKVQIDPRDLMVKEADGTLAHG